MPVAEMNQYDQIYEDEGIIEVPMPDWKITNHETIQGKVIANIGGGTSKDIWHLTADNICYGIDASPVALAVAERHGVRPILINVEDDRIPLPDRSADIVICKDVLEHVLHPEDLLKEARRVLKRDGYAVINVPNHFCLNQRIKFVFKGSLMWDSAFHRHWKIFNSWNYMHVRFFTYFDFLTLLKSQGFAPIKRFWDLGSFNHYFDPEQIIPHFRTHLNAKASLTRKEKVVKYVVLPLLSVIDAILPRRVRSAIAALRPSLLSGSFYMWCRQSED